jgi:hypothetical protein
MAHFNGPRPLYRWQLGLIAASLPRRLIPVHEGCALAIVASQTERSYPSPSRFNSRRAAATRTSRSQSLRSPDPLRLRACSAASRMRASCSGRRRTRMDALCRRSSSIFGLAMPRV